MVETAATIWRDYVTDGVPSSGSHKPIKREIREWGLYLETGVLGASGGGLLYDTKADMDADLAHDANSMAWVMGDTTLANRGIYQKTGASGAGSWTKLSELPYGGVVKASDAGVGTANAIVATTDVPLSLDPYGSLILMNVYRANTGAVTVALNGEAARSLVTNSGNTLASGALAAGMLVAFVDNGTTYRLMTDIASTVLQNAVLPAGGTTGQALLKLSNADFNAGWSTISTALLPVETQIAAAGEDTSPADADTWGYVVGTALKRLTWANLKAALKAYFDTVYISAAHTHTISDVTGLQTALDLKATLASPTFTGTVVLPSAQALTDPVITGAVKEDVYTITDGAGFQIDPSNGSVQFVTLGANRTPAATNFQDGESVTLRIADGTAYTITWTTVAVVWKDGTAPTLATSGYTEIHLAKAGNVIRGVHIGDFAS